jgi:hypothetical protein
MSTTAMTLTPQFVLGRPLQQLCYTQIYNYLPRRAPLPLFTIQTILFPRRQLSSSRARLDPRPSLFPVAMLGLVPPVRYPFLRRRHPFSSPHVPGRRPAPLLLDSPPSYQHTLHRSCSGVSAGGRDPSPFLPRLFWHTSFTSLPHAHARAGAFSQTPISRPTATVVLPSSCYLHLWSLLYPLTSVAFSLFPGACFTSPTLGCLSQEVHCHLLSYD